MLSRVIVYKLQATGWITTARGAKSVEVFKMVDTRSHLQLRIDVNKYIYLRLIALVEVSNNLAIVV